MWLLQPTGYTSATVNIINVIYINLVDSYNEYDWISKINASKYEVDKVWLFNQKRAG